MNTDKLQQNETKMIDRAISDTEESERAMFPAPAHAQQDAIQRVRLEKCESELRGETLDEKDERIFSCYQRISKLEAHAQRLADALKAAQKFIAKLEKLDVLTPNSDSGLDWDTRYIIREALEQWEKAQ